MPRRKKSPLEPTPKRMRAYEMPNLVNVRVQPDPIREIENEAMRDLSNEYRQLRVEEMIAKKRKQLAKTSPSDDTDMQKKNLDIIEGVIKVAKELQPQAGKDETLEYVKLIKEVLMESTKNQPGRGPSFFESIISDPNLYQRAQDIFGRGKTGETNSSDIEIEKLRGERDSNNRKWDLELRKLQLQNEDRRGNMEMIAGILGPVLAAGGAQLAQNMNQTGMDMGSRMRNPGNPAPGSVYQELLKDAGLQGETGELHFKCTCGYDKVMVVPVPIPAQISCPGCGQSLNTGPPQLSDLETAAKWRPQS